MTITPTITPTITLTCEEAKQLLAGFERVGWARTEHADILRARLAQPEPEPVAYKITGKLGHICSFYGAPDVRKGDYVYTAPPQHKEWQGLTDEERDEIYNNNQAWVHAVEAKLKEKNNG